MSTGAMSRRKMAQLAIGTAGAALAASACPAVAAEAGKTKRPSYIKDDSGISYYDVKAGSGSNPMEGDFVVVDYVAFLSNGAVFDSRKGFVFQMGQRQVIPGLEAAILSMKPGGERKAVLPPQLAYGEKGVCVGQDRNECLVPPNQTLGYDITLQRVAISPT